MLKDAYLTHTTLVYALCSPSEVRENKMFLQGDIPTATYGDLSQIQFDHTFQQIGDPALLPSASAGTGLAGAPLTYTSSYLTLECVNMRVEEWKSHIKGYMISDSAQNKILGSIKQHGGFVFPSQEVFMYQMNNGPTAAGLKAQLNISLFNTSSILVGYPQTPTQLPVLRNPSQVAVQLKLNNEMIPNEGYDSHGLAHLQDQIGIASLDGPLNPSKDFENSIILEHNKPDGTRYTNRLADDSSYMPQFQTERSDSAFVIDGINTKGQNVPIELLGKPKYSGAYDTYLHNDPTDLNHFNIQKPILLECRDSFFVLDLEGCHYFSDKVPRGSQTEE
jgi:hypothetical protein